MRSWSRGPSALAAIALVGGLVAAAVLIRIGMPMDQVLLGSVAGAAFCCLDFVVTHGWSK
jgi:hypothetical protein